MVTHPHYHDSCLLQLIRSGNTIAYEQLYNKYVHLLRKRAHALLNDEMEAEDLVQSVFIELWVKKIFLDIRTSVGGYLHKAVYNRSLNLIRQNKKKRNHLMDYTLLYAETMSDKYGNEYDEENALMVFIASMPLKRMQVFRSVYLDNKKYKEVASEMGISVNTVKTHLRLAVNILHRRLVTEKSGS